MMMMITLLLVMVLMNKAVEEQVDVFILGNVTTNKQIRTIVS